MEAVRPRHVSVLDALGFLTLWFRRPRSIGAITPSGRRLAAAVAREVDFSGAGVIVELGGGTGSVTRALVERATDTTEIVVIEREPSLCALLSARFPGIRVLEGDAEDLGKLLADAGIGPVKAVVSGLPLLSLSRMTCRRIVRESFAALAEGGVFVQFTYGFASPIGPSHARRARIAGRRTGWVLRNLPPAALWCYRHESEARSRTAPGGRNFPLSY
jgi:phosphatidylethanolamine/phosphatidyl-N-methylethanolamine N-methyltransferase